jgi:hypothetical protein
VKVFERVIGAAVAAVIIGGALAVSSHEARAECTPAQLFALQAQNMSETRIREICANMTEADAPGAQSKGAPGAAAPGQPRRSDRCYTPAINCILFENQRVDSSCWCVTPFGPSYGRVK